MRGGACACTSRRQSRLRKAGSGWPRSLATLRACGVSATATCTRRSTASPDSGSCSCSAARRSCSGSCSRAASAMTNDSASSAAASSSGPTASAAAAFSTALAPGRARAQLRRSDVRDLLKRLAVQPAQGLDLRPQLLPQPQLLHPRSALSRLIRRRRPRPRGRLVAAPGRALSNVAFAAGVAHTNTDTATFRITQRQAVAQRHQRASAPLLRSAVPNPIRGKLKSSQKIPFFFALKAPLFAAIRIFVSPPLTYNAFRYVSESFVSPLCIPGVGARPGVGGSGPGSPQATPTGHR